MTRSSDERFDALLAATAEQLCEELKIETPRWILAVPAVRDPWFVSGKVFVMENFLSRV